MSKKLTSHVVLGFAVSSALVGAAAGCSSGAAGGEDPAVSVSTTGAALNADWGRGDGDDHPRAKHGVTDPGVRGGPPGAGQPIAGLNVNDLALWNRGRFRSVEREATCDTCNDITQGQPIPPDAPPDTTNSAGMGPRFNNTSCTLDCHSQPAIGGTSPFVNPAFTAAKAKGAKNKVPFFETLDGPMREVRFKFRPDGSRDGGVHQIFTVAGRSDSPSCTTLAQPDFSDVDNLSFRIPLPMFGLGLIESIQDKQILQFKNSNLGRKNALGIHGHTNNSGNDGTIARFGWKAQNKSITQFAGEAYNVELGISNDLNPNVTDEDDNCLLTKEPADVPHVGDGSDPTDPTDNFSDPVNVLPVWMTFVTFMRGTDQPTPGARDASADRGLDVFNDIGCAECHVPAMTTKPDNGGPRTPALRGKTVTLFSDLLVHHMGGTLADNVIQGGAGPDEFRSTPLWGVGQRIFFLHDGRTKSLVDAILLHYSPASHAHGSTPAYPASEANQVVRNFADLPSGKQQDLINFLRTL